jgi:hypothetical protein
MFGQDGANVAPTGAMISLAAAIFLVFTPSITGKEMKFKIVYGWNWTQVVWI